MSQHWGWGGADRRKRVANGALLIRHPLFDSILEVVLEKLTCQDKGSRRDHTGIDMVGQCHLQGAVSWQRGMLVVQAC